MMKQFKVLLWVCLSSFGIFPATVQGQREQLLIERQGEAWILRWKVEPLGFLAPDTYLFAGRIVEYSTDLKRWVQAEQSMSGGRFGELIQREVVISANEQKAFFRIARGDLDFSDLDLARFDLTGADLNGAVFTGADLRNVDLSGVNLEGADLRGADLRGADLRAVRLAGADLSGAKLNGANFIGADLSGVIADAGELEGALQLSADPPNDFFEDVAGGGIRGGFAVSPVNFGFSTGGAKDVGNFRQNIESEYLPLPTDITYEGLFYDYFFDTGQTERCEQLFCPSYSQALSMDPFSGEQEIYLAVGLNSGIQETDFKRPLLNLVIVLDVSGSMDSPFDRYYYDGQGRRIELEETEAEMSKMEVAAQAVTALLTHLVPEDRVGIVTFNSSARVMQPLARMGDLDIEAVKRRVLALYASGGTNMSAGMQMGSGQFTELLEIDPATTENRVIFVTDAMPNTGETSRDGLFGQIERNAKRGIYSTAIGVGIDFNSDLIESLTKNRGANYYSVHSPSQFVDRMDDGFDFMVTPLVFNLRLTLDGAGWSIEKVYGSPEANQATGELLKVNTLFPSRTVDGETRGGLVLLKLAKNPEAENRDLTLTARYENREGESFESAAGVTITVHDGEAFDNTGIRKGILLARYANLVQNWIIDERTSYEEDRPVLPVLFRTFGIIPPPWPGSQLGEWERRSAPLFVSSPYRNLFADFLNYFIMESDALDDDTLSQEIELLERLSRDELASD